MALGHLFDALRDPSVVLLDQAQLAEIVVTVRVDHNLSARNKMFVRANMYNRDTSRNDYFETQATGLQEFYAPRGASFDEVMAKLRQKYT